MVKALHSLNFRAQGDVYRFQSKLESTQNDVDRLSAELDKANIIASKHKEDHKKLQDEYAHIHETHDRTAMELARTKDSEAKFKEDAERSTFDLNMVRERFDKSTSELVKCKSENKWSQSLIG